MVTAAEKEIERIAKACDGSDDMQRHIAACTTALSGPLKQVLTSFNAGSAANDEIANSAQRNFKLLAYASAVSMFVSGIAGGYSLYDVPARPGSSHHVILTALQVGFGLLGVFLAWLTQKLGLHPRWVLNRSIAESFRLDRYSHVLETSQISDLPLALEYVRNFHVLRQSQYYRKQSRKFTTAARRLTWLRWIAFLGLVFIALPLLAKFVQYMPATYAKHWVTVSLLDLIDGREKLFTFVGLLSTCLLALLAGIGAISLAARNAEQYGSMAAFLDHVLAEQIPRLRSAAESGRNEGRDSILAFWRDLRGLLQREHNDWAYHSLKRAEDAMNDILSTWKKLGE